MCSLPRSGNGGAFCVGGALAKIAFQGGGASLCGRGLAQSRTPLHPSGRVLFDGAGLWPCPRPNRWLGPSLGQVRTAGAPGPSGPLCALLLGLYMVPLRRLGMELAARPQPWSLMSCAFWTRWSTFRVSWPAWSSLRSGWWALPTAATLRSGTAADCPRDPPGSYRSCPRWSGRSTSASVLQPRAWSTCPTGFCWLCF